MNEPITYSAPWATSLKVVTGSLSIFLVGMAVIGVLAGPQEDPMWRIGMIVLPLAILFIAAPFTIRGYVLTPDAVFVQRLGWKTRCDLAGLTSAEADPEAMSKSIRTFGNGGMFCCAGAFRNKRLGSYRAFVTDPKRAVVLKFPNRTVVLTPDSPEDFVARIRELRNL